MGSANIRAIVELPSVFPPRRQHSFFILRPFSSGEIPLSSQTETGTKTSLSYYFTISSVTTHVPSVTSAVVTSLNDSNHNTEVDVEGVENTELLG